MKAAKFRTMATSRTGMNFADTDPFRLTRMAVLSGTNGELFRRECRGQGLLKTQLKERVREAAQHVLGNSTYDSLRDLLLGRREKTRGSASLMSSRGTPNLTRFVSSRFGPCPDAVSRSCTFVRQVDSASGYLFSSPLPL